MQIMDKLASKSAEVAEVVESSLANTAAVVSEGQVVIVMSPPVIL